MADERVWQEEGRTFKRRSLSLWWRSARPFARVADDAARRRENHAGPLSIRASPFETPAMQAPQGEGIE
ncbi:hypothetical protein GGD62_004556 [Bradyrhizobium sp. ERR14]|nr:hypothetical protein [Bradyrhizobium sp. ERR14]